MAKNEENNRELNINMKINRSAKDGIFDYSKEYTNYNEKIEKNKFIFKNKNNIIKIYDSQDDGENEEMELVNVNKKNNSFQLNIIHFLYQDSFFFIENINNYFWYVINSDFDTIRNTNDDYYISKNDIIKIGVVKYIVREIKITNNNQKNNYYGENDPMKYDLEKNCYKQMKKKLSSLNPPILDCTKCEYCGCLLIKFCKCDQFDHFKEIKNWTKEHIVKKKNIGKTFRYYHFNDLYKCDKCNTWLPLKFKLNIKEPFQCKLNDNDEEFLNYNIGDDITFDFIKINKPNDSDYLILESIEYEDKFKKSSVKKSIHVIKLTGEDIKIGRKDFKDQNDAIDVLVDDSSVCKEHAIIKYDNGKLLLKNLSRVAGTLVFIPKFKINISEKKVLLQIDKVSLEAQVIIKQDSNEEGGSK